MDLIERAITKFNYYKALVQQKNYPLAMAGDAAWQYPDQQGMIRHASLYEKSSWVHTAIQFVANAAATTDFEIFTRAKGEQEEVEDHPFEQLLRRPNPLQSRFEFLVATFSYLKLGDSFWWLNCPQGEGSAPVELWTVEPQSIRPVPDGRMFIRGYEYTYNGGTMLLEPWEVVHFKTFNPLSQFLGLSDVNAIELQANSDLATVKKDFRANGINNGRMPGILAFADDFQPVEWESMKGQIDENSKKMRQYMLLHGVKAGGLQWLQTAMSNRDMQSLESRTLTRDEIFGVLAPGLASTLVTNATEANAKAGKATLAEYALYPMLEAVGQKITNDVLPLYGENLIGAFEEIRVKDKVMELEEIKLYSSTHTLAEIREKYYGDQPLGDDRDKLLPGQINAQTGDGTKEPTPPALAAFAGNNNPPAQQPADTTRGDPTANPIDPGAAMDAAAVAEVKRWRKVARKAIREGKAVKEFESDVLPAEVMSTIKAGLALATTDEQVMAVFAKYRGRQEETDDLAEELRLAREWLEANG